MISTISSLYGAIIYYVKYLEHFLLCSPNNQIHGKVIIHLSILTSYDENVDYF